MLTRTIFFSAGSKALLPFFCAFLSHCTNFDRKST
ncbi:hypothetical protein PC1_2791 [Pectobacterium carotovorum subsp. carotovorum PC1]|uniref:Uncharacterized protein n=1 Tax=Pectobacterium carotovorum subsp. carotovorum (strain PC1) TaxID=561230 RepID=C6DA65_PECCP|nr:hypothetical protein PC1_2791 [Pectobacterium carotovorum subsp. carotovorum PC1]